MPGEIPKSCGPTTDVIMLGTGDSLYSRTACSRSSTLMPHGVFAEQHANAAGVLAPADVRPRSWGVVRPVRRHPSGWWGRRCPVELVPIPGGGDPRYHPLNVTAPRDQLAMNAV